VSRRRPCDGRADLPLVSVLTPSMNQGRFLRDCIASVAAQSYTRIEHIISDGGSSDETLDVLRAAPTSVSWVSKPDRGQAHAVNEAFLASSGEIVGWINADDGYADRRAIEWVVDAFTARPGIDVLHAHALLVNEDNVVLQVLPALRFEMDRLRAVNYVWQPAVFFRRSVIEREGFLDESLHYVLDRELWFRLGGSSRFELLDRVVAIDRHQRSRKVLQKAFTSELTAHEALLGRRHRDFVTALCVRVAIRLRGARIARRLRIELEPALPLIFPSRAKRIVWQLLARRHRFPFTSASNVNGRDIVDVLR
jgi:glycosyltransferase involved in cell wall biosynthesis